MGQADVSGFTLPDRRHLTRTNDEDPLAFYYHPLTGWAYRRRLVMALDALGPGPFQATLEVGYGSGILLPELCRRSRRVSAIDTHEEVAAVRRMLEAERIGAELSVGTILELPYAAASFDALVCLSVLEHLDAATLPRGLAEIRRVCRPGATVVLGFPVRNVATDTFYRLVGFSPREIHPSSHRDIEAAARQAFAEVASRRWPAALPLDLSLYVVSRAACL